MNNVYLLSDIMPYKLLSLQTMVHLCRVCSGTGVYRRLIQKIKELIAVNQQYYRNIVMRQLSLTRKQSCCFKDTYIHNNHSIHYSIHYYIINNMLSFQRWYSRSVGHGIIYDTQKDCVSIFWDFPNLLLQNTRTTYCKNMAHTHGYGNYILSDCVDCKIHKMLQYRFHV